MIKRENQNESNSSIISRVPEEKVAKSAYSRNNQRSVPDSVYYANLLIKNVSSMEDASIRNFQMEPKSVVFIVDLSNWLWYSARFGSRIDCLSHLYYIKLQSELFLLHGLSDISNVKYRVCVRAYSNVFFAEKRHCHWSICFDDPLCIYIIRKILLNFVFWS